MRIGSIHDGEYDETHASQINTNSHEISTGCSIDDNNGGTIASGTDLTAIPAPHRSFDWQFSLRYARRERMLDDLLLYRLALGQPDPDAFLRMLERVGARESDARSLAIDLSAISRFPEETA